MRLIDADALNSTIRDFFEFYKNKVESENAKDGCEIARDIVSELIYGQKQVDAVPVVHGHWEWGKSYTLTDKTKNRVPCSNCHMSQVEQLGMNYCTNCGALMDEVSE